MRAGQEAADVASARTSAPSRWRFFEEYYGRKYPGDKLDLIAIPDFAAGAMENLGAITFRETALLVDEAAATHAERERVADVVAHENAHMWFGDLVTMSWWNGLWLNEAFATFMEMLAVDAWKPEWQRWTTFGVSRSAALSVDGLHSTRPIEFPVEAPKDADAMFDVLTYEKGASVLRMLEQYIGPTVFRDGVRRYLEPPRLRQHRDGRPVGGAGRGGAAADPRSHGRLGLPSGLSARSTCSRRRRTGSCCRQRRFTLSAATSRRPAEEPSGGRRCSCGSCGKAADRPERTSARAAAEAATCRHAGRRRGGAGQRGRPRLLPRPLRAGPAGRAAATRSAALEAIERFNLVNDAWAAVLAGLTPLTEYLDLTARFRGERDKNVWSVLDRLVPDAQPHRRDADRPRLAALVRDRAGPAAAELGWQPRRRRGSN